LRRVRRWLNRRDAELSALGEARRLQGPDVEALLPAERPSLITIEILNPFELAQKQSRLAGTFGVLAPSLLRQEVLRQAVARIRQQLEAEGVQAEVRLVRGA
jgi:hypothetical protein